MHELLFTVGINMDLERKIPNQKKDYWMSIEIYLGEMSYLL
jgi:hypothetical protein